MWQFLKDLEIEIPFDPTIPLLGIYPKDYKSFYYKDTCTHMFIADPFTIDDRLDRENVAIYTMEYYAAIKMMNLCPL